MSLPIRMSPGQALSLWGNAPMMRPAALARLIERSGGVVPAGVASQVLPVVHAMIPALRNQGLRTREMEQVLAGAEVDPNKAVRQLSILLEGYAPEAYEAALHSETMLLGLNEALVPIDLVPDIERLDAEIHTFEQDFDVVDSLGGGGEFDVVLVRGKATGAFPGEVMVAHILKDFTFEGVDEIRQAVRALRRLTHDHVVQYVRDYGGRHPLYGKPEFVLLTKYVEGESLKERFERTRPLTAVELQRVEEQGLSALEYSWSRGVIHKDPKPSNFIVSGEGEEIHATVIDYGIAKILGDRTRTGTVWAGTPEYAAPEQLGKGNPVITKAVDVFKLGLTLLDAALGRRRQYDVGVQPVAPDLAKLQDMRVPAEFIEDLRIMLETDPGKRLAIVERLAARATAADARPQTALQVVETASEAVAPAPRSEIMWPGITQPLRFPVRSWDRFDDVEPMIAIGALDFIGLGMASAPLWLHGVTPAEWFICAAGLILTGSMTAVLRNILQLKKKRLHYIPGRGFVENLSFGDMFRARTVYRVSNIDSIKRHQGDYVFLDKVAITESWGLEYGLRRGPIPYDYKVRVTARFQGRDLTVSMPHPATLRIGDLVRLVGKVGKSRRGDESEMIIDGDTWTFFPEEPPALPSAETAELPVEFEEEGTLEAVPVGAHE